ncbi:hypothetical protein V8C34DRAFT_299694 [Trichoderma compactum]
MRSTHYLILSLALFIYPVFAYTPTCFSNFAIHTGTSNISLKLDIELEASCQADAQCPTSLVSPLVPASRSTVLNEDEKASHSAPKKAVDGEISVYWCDHAEFIYIFRVQVSIC